MASTRWQLQRSSLVPTAPTTDDGRVLKRFSSTAWITASHAEGPYAHSAHLQVNLGLPNEDTGYYILTKGNTAKGSVVYRSVEYNPSTDEMPNLMVNVTIMFNDASQLAAASVATLAKDASTEFGVGVYLPNGDVDMNIILNVLVPTATISTTPERSNVLGGLSSHTHNLNHEILLDERNAISQLVVISKGDGDISIQSRLKIGIAKLQTDSGAIRGEICVLVRAALQSESGALVVSTRLGEGIPVMLSKDIVPSLWMRSNSGFIGGSVRTFVAQAFSIVAETTSANINIPITQLPLGTKLEVQLQSQEGDIQLTLEPTYEGHADLHSARGTVELSLEPDLPDPAGRARRHNAVGKSDPAFRSWLGDIWWGEEEDRSKGNGTAVLRTGQGTCLLTIKE